MNAPNHNLPHIAPWPSNVDPAPLDLARAASTALTIQNACNLTPILAAWSRARSTAGNYPAGSVHPLDVLFLSKVASLMGVDASSIGSVTLDGSDAFRPAYEWCSNVAGDVDVPRFRVFLPATESVCRNVKVLLAARWPAAFFQVESIPGNEEAEVIGEGNGANAIVEAVYRAAVDAISKGVTEGGAL